MKAIGLLFLLMLSGGAQAQEAQPREESISAEIGGQSADLDVVEEEVTWIAARPE